MFYELLFISICPWIRTTAKKFFFHPITELQYFALTIICFVLLFFLLVLFIKMRRLRIFTLIWIKDLLNKLFFKGILIININNKLNDCEYSCWQTSDIRKYINNSMISSLYYSSFSWSHKSDYGKSNIRIINRLINRRFLL